MTKELIYCAKDGYDIIAKYYDKWKWQNLWTLNELPLLVKWADSLNVGIGFDAGTGSGNNLNYFLSKGHKITAADISPEMLRICYQKHLEYISNGQLICEELDIRDLLDFNRKFDWITCNRVLSHVDNLENIVNIFSKLLVNNGQCFISDIHPKHNYSITKVDVNDEKILIETYKHSINEYRMFFRKYNFEILEFKEIGTSELNSNTQVANFKNLLFQTKPIFFYFIVRLKISETFKM